MRLVSPPAEAINIEGDVAARSGSARALVVWAGRTHGRDSTIYARMIGASGVPRSTEAPLSDLGAVSPPGTSSHDPLVAFNSRRAEFLAVWHERGQAVGFSGLYGRRIDVQGVPIGERFLLVPPAFRVGWGARLVYNARNDEYLVAFDGSAANGHRAIYVLRLAADGAPADQPKAVSAQDGCARPTENDVVWNTRSNEYLVGWICDNTSHTTLLGQRLRGDGSEVGEDDKPLTRRSTFHAFLALAHNPRRDEYLVVYDRDGVLHARRLTRIGRRIGTRERRISSLRRGVVGSDSLSVTYARGLDEYLVAWAAASPISEPEFDTSRVFGQRLDSAGRQRGVDDFVVSHRGRPGPFDAFDPALSFVSRRGGFLALWSREQGSDESQVGLFARRVR